MDSKNTYLKNIIREELNLVKEQITLDPVTPTPKAGGTETTPTPPTPPAPKANPFKTQSTADAFRNWLHQSQYEFAVKNGVSKTGSMTDPKLIKAYEAKKKEYWAYIKDRKEKKSAAGEDNGGNFTFLGFTAEELAIYGLGAWISWVVGKNLVRGVIRKWRKDSKLTTDQAMKIASNPGKFKEAVNQASKSNPKALKKELQTLNPDEILTDDDVVALQKALGNPRLSVDILIQARRKTIITFQNAIAAGKLPTTSKGKIITADQLINTLTAAERARYANTIRQLYAKIKKKQQFKSKVKRTWNNFRDKLPYGD
jgi:hypothetical protein